MRPFSGIHGPHFFHLFLGQFKIKDADIARDPLRFRGLRQNNQAVLHFKSEKDLSCVFSVLLSQLLNNRMGKELQAAM